MTWIHTYSGRRFYPLDPDWRDIVLEDIAHALSRICRFGGHVENHYSVAQHSVLVSLVCDPADQRWGLLHDAAEAYVGDMVGPIKHQQGMEAFRHAEDAVQTAICVRYGLPLIMPDSVHLADRRVLATEGRDLRELTGLDDLLPPPMPERIFAWTADEAKRAFLARAKVLGIR